MTFLEIKTQEWENRNKKVKTAHILNKADNRPSVTFRQSKDSFKNNQQKLKVITLPANGFIICPMH